MRPTDDELIHFLCDLIAIDSTNPGLVPGAAGEEALVTFLARRLTAAGRPLFLSLRRVDYTVLLGERQHFNNRFGIGKYTR